MPGSVRVHIVFVFCVLGRPAVRTCRVSVVSGLSCSCGAFFVPPHAAPPACRRHRAHLSAHHAYPIIHHCPVFLIAAAERCWQMCTHCNRHPLQTKGSQKATHTPGQRLTALLAKDSLKATHCWPKPHCTAGQRLTECHPQDSLLCWPKTHSRLLTAGQELTALFAKDSLKADRREGGWCCNHNAASTPPLPPLPVSLYSRSACCCRGRRAGMILS
jgi:hypothetical protein